MPSNNVKLKNKNLQIGLLNKLVHILDWEQKPIGKIDIKDDFLLLDSCYANISPLSSQTYIDGVVTNNKTATHKFITRYLKPDKVDGSKYIYYDARWFKVLSCNDIAEQKQFTEILAKEEQDDEQSSVKHHEDLFIK